MAADETTGQETIVRLTKLDLTRTVAETLDIPLIEAGRIVEVIFDRMVRAIRSGDKVEIRGFGSFRTRHRRPRVGRNPKTGVHINVPAKKIPYFKASRQLLVSLGRLAGEK
jgi:integration host factor subunit beta